MTGEEEEECPGGGGGGNPPVKNAIFNHSKLSTTYFFFPSGFLGGSSWPPQRMGGLTEAVLGYLGEYSGGIFKVVVL